MEEKLNEIIIEEISRRIHSIEEDKAKEYEKFKNEKEKNENSIESLDKNKKELEIALKNIEGKREIKDGKLVPTYEEKEILGDISKINLEIDDKNNKILMSRNLYQEVDEKANKKIESLKGDINRVNEIEKTRIEFENEKTKIQRDIDNLNKTSEELKTALKNIEGKREIKDGKLVPTYEEKEIHDDLSAIDKEIKIKNEQMLTFNGEIEKLDEEMLKFYSKYEIKEKNKQEENQQEKDEAKTNKEPEQKLNNELNQESQNKQNIIQEPNEKKAENKIENVKENSYISTKEVLPHMDSEEDLKKAESKEQQEAEGSEFFQSIEIDANSQTVNLLFEGGKNNKQIAIKEAIDAKRNLYKRINLKKEISKFCKEEKVNFFKRLKLSRGMDPTIVTAIAYYGAESDLHSYFNSIAKSDSLPFDIHYILTDSNLDKRIFNKLNKYAKRDRNISGITAEGIKENIFKRVIKGIKKANVLKAFDKPKQIAEHGVEKAKNAKNKVKNVKNNAKDKVKNAKDSVANKTAEKMVKFADRIKVEGNAKEVADKYKVNNSSEHVAQNTNEEKSK